jgi:hypothetical protein
MWSYGVDAKGNAGCRPSGKGNRRTLGPALPAGPSISDGPVPAQRNGFPLVEPLPQLSSSKSRSMGLVMVRASRLATCV